MSSKYGRDEVAYKLKLDDHVFSGFSEKYANSLVFSIYVSLVKLTLTGESLMTLSMDGRLVAALDNENPPTDNCDLDVSAADNAGCSTPPEYLNGALFSS